MIRHLASVGCSVALGIGTAGFLGCDQEPVQTEPYGNQRDFNEPLDSTAPGMDDSGLDLEPNPPSNSGMERPGMTAPRDLDTQPNTPTIPDAQDEPTLPDANTMPDLPDDDLGTGGGM